MGQVQGADVALHVLVEGGLPELQLAPDHVILDAGVRKLHHSRAQFLRGHARDESDRGSAESGENRTTVPNSYPTKGVRKGQDSRSNAMFVQSRVVLVSKRKERHSF